MAAFWAKLLACLTAIGRALMPHAEKVLLVLATKTAVEMHAENKEVADENERLRKVIDVDAASRDMPLDDKLRDAKERGLV